MKSTGDLQYIKRMNSSIVLDIIRKHQPLSRSDIAVKSGLNKTTVSSLVNDLMQNQLVTESGPGLSSGGRKPTMLLFNPLAAFAIGIDIQIEEVKMVLTDLEGRIVYESNTPLTDHHPEIAAQLIIQMVKELILTAPQSPYGVIGLGIGIPGLVESNQRIVSAPNLGWENINFIELLQQELELKLYIDNEANMGALGEKHYGAGRSSQNLIYLSVGTGIGAGIIMNDELYSGISNFSGEVGHMTIVEQGPLCRCGNYGCWETLASEKALVNYSTSTKASDRSHAYHENKPTLECLINAAKKDESRALSSFHEIGTQLGVGLANLINILNPELIIIGNRLSLAGEWLKPAIIETLDKRSLSFHRRKVNLEFAELADQSTALGSASYAITGFISRIPFY